MKKALKSIIKFVAITYFTMYMVATTTLTFSNDDWEITKGGVAISSVNLWEYCYFAVYSVLVVMLITAVVLICKYGYKKFLKKKA